MPYSKNPHQYPPMLLAMLDRMTSQAGEIRFKANGKSDAASQRVRVQSFFAAVRGHSEELVEAATRARSRASTSNKSQVGQSLLEQEYHAAQALAEQWETRALTAARWLVTTDAVTHEVVIKPRALEGSFADSLSDWLAQSVQPAAAEPTGLEDQMALLRKASQGIPSNE